MNTNESEPHYEIKYAGTSATITTEFLPRGTSEDTAISIARDYKKDLWKGFISLRKVCEIDIAIKPIMTPEAPSE